MEYLVNTSGEISRTHNKTYVIKANSKKEAQEKAKNKFETEFECVNIDAQANTYTRTKRALIACALMLIAIIISFCTYSYSAKAFFFFSKTETFSIAPQMESCIFAIIFYCAYVIRFKGIERTLSAVIDIAFCVLTVLLLASVFQLILSNENIKLLGILPAVDSYTVIVVAIITSLLGIKVVSAGCMAFVALAALSNLSVASKAMRTWGVVYIMCAFLGILFCLSAEPAVLEALPQIKQSFSKTAKYIKNDFNSAKNQLEEIKNSTTQQLK